MGEISTLLVVKNLKESIAFFVNVLSFTLVEQYPDCVKLQYGSQQVIMFQGNLESVDYKHGFNANSTLLITVSNLDNKIEELKSKGVCFIHKTPNENRWGRYSAFKDPSGIVHELFELHS